MKKKVVSILLCTLICATTIVTASVQEDNDEQMKRTIGRSYDGEILFMIGRISNVSHNGPWGVGISFNAECVLLIVITYRMIHIELIRDQVCLVPYYYIGWLGYMFICACIMGVDI